MKSTLITLGMLGLACAQLQPTINVPNYCKKPCLGPLITDLVINGDF